MLEQIWSAWHAFRRGKHATTYVDEFEYDLGTNLENLAREIANRTYRHGGYRRVAVQEKKRRDLAVATVRDRVVHRLVYNELTEIFDKTFDFDVWSCRKKKGLHECLSRTQQLIAKYCENFIWRMDIEKFFDHVDHAELSRNLRRRVRDDWMRYLCDEIINSYSQAGGGANFFRGKTRDSDR